MRHPCRTRGRRRRGPCRPVPGEPRGLPLARQEGFLRLPACFLAALPLFAGCGDAEPGKITDVREGPATTDFRPVPTAERFGFQPGGGRGGSNPHQGMQAAAAGGFQWTTPEGWTEKPLSDMRQANFGVERDPQVECYLSVVQGGIAANVNRWRTSQMGLEALSPAAVAALPK